VSERRAAARDAGTTPAAHSHGAPSAARDRSTGVVRRLAWRWLTLVAVALAASLAFTAIGREVLADRTTGADEAVRAWVRAHRTPVVDDAARWLTTLGAPIVLAFIAAAVAVRLWRARGRATAAMVVLAPAVASVAFTSIKHVVQRRRPAGGALLGELAFSFPSGHATVSAAVLVTLAVVLVRERLVRPVWGVALAVAGPLVIGATRVWLDAHYASDVLAGWCLGAAIAALAVGATARPAARRVPPR
jgi:undecaprenyl-diphosphatase